MRTRDLVIEETQRQIDYVIQAIPEDKKNFSKDFSKEQLQYKELADFLLGYELGYVVGKSLESSRRTNNMGRARPNTKGYPDHHI
jgi:hypothetical protein